MLGAVLQRNRIAAGLTQEQLADKAGIDRTHVSKLERGKQSPTVDTLLRLCHAMGVSASVIIAAIENEPISPRKRRQPR